MNKTVGDPQLAPNPRRVLGTQTRTGERAGGVGDDLVGHTRIYGGGAPAPCLSTAAKFARHRPISTGHRPLIGRVGAAAGVQERVRR